MTKMRSENDVIDRMSPLISKKKLICHDILDRIRLMRKTKEDNDVTNRIGAVYVEIETQLL